MNGTVAANEPAAPPARSPGFWRRRLVEPVRDQLTQGITPDRLAATFAVGTVCSLLPFLGLTSLLNLVVGMALRLNQPILQTLNQLLGPLQLALILVHVRVGEAIWGAEAAQFTVGEVVRVFREESLGEFLRQFGRAGGHALTAWLVAAPVLAVGVHFALRPIFRRAAARMRRASAAAGGA